MLGLWMPEWFQVVKAASPVQSGVNLLPAMLAHTIIAIVVGVLTTKIGYCNPFILMGLVFMSIGSGLFTTFEVGTGSPRWIGYQVLYGLGAGQFMTGPLLAVQSVLSPADTPVGVATVSFFQMFGGAFFTGVSQTIFNQQLIKELLKNVPGVDIAQLLAAGTAAVHKVASPDELPGIVLSYNRAILDPFYLAAAVTATAFFCALGIEWINVKGKNLVAEAA